MRSITQQAEPIMFKFDKHMSVSVQGVAICIMLFHHFFAFPEWVNSGNTFYDVEIFGYGIAYLLGCFGKICISIYAFISGYGLYTAFSRKTRIFDYKYIVKKILSVLINYWLVVLLLQTSAYINNPEVNVDIMWILKQMLLIDISGNPFVGYLRFYVCALISLPVLYWVFRRTRFDAAIAIGLPFVSIVLRSAIDKYGMGNSLGYNYVLYLPYVITGMMSAKNLWFERLYAWIGKLKGLTNIVPYVLIVICILVRELSGKGLVFDSYFAFIMVFSIAVIMQSIKNGRHRVRKAWEFLGKHSANIWYIHAILIFSSDTLQRMLYAPKIPIVILVWGIVLCLPGSYLINFIMSKFVVRLFNK